VRAALAHRNGMNMSDVAIAEHIGVTDKTVAKYRASVTSEFPESTKRTGRDGRTITVANIGKRVAVRKSKLVSLPAVTVMAAAAPSVSDSPCTAPDKDGVGDDRPATPSIQPQIRDELGRVIESKEIIAAFANRPKFKSLMCEASELKKKFIDLTVHVGGQWAVLYQKQFDADVDNLRAALRYSVPYALCPYCGGAKCSKCKQIGWMPEERFKNVPIDIRGGK
jgi:hypothetical protein